MKGPPVNERMALQMPTIRASWSLISNVSPIFKGVFGSGERRCSANSSTITAFGCRSASIPPSVIRIGAPANVVESIPINCTTVRLPFVMRTFCTPE